MRPSAPRQPTAGASAPLPSNAHRPLPRRWSVQAPGRITVRTVRKSAVLALQRGMIRGKVCSTCGDDAYKCNCAERCLLCKLLLNPARPGASVAHSGKRPRTTLCTCEHCENCGKRTASKAEAGAHSLPACALCGLNRGARAPPPAPSEDTTDGAGSEARRAQGMPVGLMNHGNTCYGNAAIQVRPRASWAACTPQSRCAWLLAGARHPPPQAHGRVFRRAAHAHMHAAALPTRPEHRHVGTTHRHFSAAKPSARV